MSVFNRWEYPNSRNKLWCVLVQHTGLNPTLSHFFTYVIWNFHLLLSAQINSPRKYYMARCGKDFSIRESICCVGRDREILQVQWHFKVSHERQTRELEENHYSPLVNMLPYHAPTEGWKGKETYAKERHVCVFLCMSGETTAQISFSSSCKHEFYIPKTESGMLLLREKIGKMIKSAGFQTS